jgi:hypothetical protein
MQVAVPIVIGIVPKLLIALAVIICAILVIVGFSMVVSNFTSKGGWICLILGVAGIGSIIYVMKESAPPAPVYMNQPMPANYGYTGYSGHPGYSGQHGHSGYSGYSGQHGHSSNSAKSALKTGFTAATNAAGTFATNYAAKKFQGAEEGGCGCGAGEEFLKEVEKGGCDCGADEETTKGGNESEKNNNSDKSKSIGVTFKEQVSVIV